MTHETTQLDRWPEFTGAVRARLKKGQAEYGDASFKRPPEELVDEIGEELADVCGWAFVLWCRIRGLEQAVSGGTGACEPTQTPKLLKAPEVAERLGLPLARVYALARKGQIGGVVRLGRQRRFDPRELDTWIQAGGLPVSGEPLPAPPSPMPLSHTRRSGR